MTAASSHGIELKGIKLDHAKRALVLLTRRWFVKRSLGWPARFRRLTPSDKRFASSLAGYHWLAFASLMLANFLRSGS